MLNLLNTCFPARAEQWRPTLEEIIPSFGQKLADNPDLYEEIVAENAKTLKLA